MADDDQKSERAAEVTGAHGHHHHHEPDGETPSGHVDHDPVCGMVVDPARTAHKAEYEGERYAFCSAGCKAKFDADPVHYAARVAHAEPHHEGAATHGDHSHPSTTLADFLSGAGFWDSHGADCVIHGWSAFWRAGLVRELEVRS